MKRALSALALLLAAVSWAAPAPAAEDGSRARLLALQRNLADISALSGEFVQEKKLDFLTEPLISHGRFYFARPDFLRWEYLSPAPTGLEIRGGRARAWTGPPDRRQPQPEAAAEAARLAAGQVMLWMNLEPEAILSAYDLSVVREAPLLMRVVPRRGAARDFLEFLTVEFSPDGRTVREVVLKEPEGRTRLSFGRVILNPPPLSE